MEPLTAIGLVVTVIKTAIEVAPSVAKAIGDMKPYAVALFQKFTGNKPTDEQRKMLEDQIDEMHNRFQRPIPPENQQ